MIVATRSALYSLITIRFRVVHVRQAEKNVSQLSCPRTNEGCTVVGTSAFYAEIHQNTRVYGIGFSNSIRLVFRVLLERARSRANS